MKKVLHSYVFRTIIAALLVIAMGAIQYEPMISGFKFWIAFVVIVCVMIYIVAMVSSMQKKNILIGQSVKSNFRKNDGKQEA